MKTSLPATVVVLGLALVACDNAKPRQAQQATGPLSAASAPAPAAAPAPMPTPGPAPIDPLSDGLAKKAGMAGFYVDYINTAQDPLNKQPAIVASGAPLTIAGFGFDAQTKTPAKGVDLVVDGKAFGAPYGSSRPDVANFYKTAKLANVGYKVSLPADAVAKGEHTLVMRVVTPDGTAYQESAPIKFTVQ